MLTDVEVKPCCEACERNKQPIADALAGVFREPGRVLEIGSGTGQHAVHFAAQMRHLTWHCSDLPDRHAGINAWIAHAGLDNLIAPVTLDVGASHWPAQTFGYAFSANTAHIMSWQNVRMMFAGLGNTLLPGGRFALYGPFNMGGCYTSEGNRKFDRSLRAEDPAMGIRDLEEVTSLALASGFGFSEDIAMPANNQLLIFSKS